MSMRMMFTMVLVAGLLADPLFAQGRSQGRGRGTGGNSGGSDVAVTAVFTFHDSDRVAFRDYFVSHKIVGQALPPGIAKNVARGKPLPPGIAKKALPPDLILGLGPRVQPGLTFAIVGDRVVALRSGLVVDVMVNVFR